jgi:hypothetical protein
MLNTDEQDDQRGLARYALSHYDMWAPDIHGKIFKNKVFGDQLNERDLTGNGCFFAHFPGMTTWSSTGYDSAVERVLQRPSGVQSLERGSVVKFNTTIIAIVIASLGILIVLFAFFTTHWPNSNLSNLSPSNISPSNPDAGPLR